jgi:hypothetical protein
VAFLAVEQSTAVILGVMVCVTAWKRNERTLRELKKKNSSLPLSEFELDVFVREKATVKDSKGTSTSTSTYVTQQHVARQSDDNEVQALG